MAKRRKSTRHRTSQINSTPNVYTGNHSQHGAKKQKLYHQRKEEPYPVDSFSKLSLEVICQILEYLPIWDVMKLECQCRHLQEAVVLHLRLLTDIDFTEGDIHGWMPSKFTDYTFGSLTKRCPELTYIYGLHFHNISRRRHRGSDIFSIPGIIEALQQMPNLQGVETSNLCLLEDILHYLPHIEIMGTFKNRGSGFPIKSQNAISLTRSAQLTSLHLTGVELRDLPRMDYLKRLYLKWVRFTDTHPFKDFAMPSLRTFVFSNCAGPQNALMYVPLMTGLVTARNLMRLELVRVPFLGGLLHHVVEDSWKVSGFRNIRKILISACKHAQEPDLGYLLITCCHKLEELFVQPSLSKDSFFYSLTYVDIDFPNLTTLSLGYVDDFPEPGTWSQTELSENGLAEYAENPAFLTDFGMKCVGSLFRMVNCLRLYNCPHIHSPVSWLNTGDFSSFSHLTDLHLHRCHAVRLHDFCRFVSVLQSLETVNLERMFQEPPKGCSRVGLSAGTGLGVSSALVADNGHDLPANQNPPGDGGANNNAGGQQEAASRNENDAESDDGDYSDSEDDDDDAFSEDEDEINFEIENQEFGDGNDNDAELDLKLPIDKNVDDVPPVDVAQEVEVEACVEVDGVVWQEESSQYCDLGPPRGKVTSQLDSNLPKCGNCTSADSSQKAHVVGNTSSTNHKAPKSSKGKMLKNRLIPGTIKGKSACSDRKKVRRSQSHVMVSKACQASSDEIRESTKNASSSVNNLDVIIGSSSPKSRLEGHQSESRKGRKRKKRCHSKKSRPVMCDKSTSTSDPVIEEDHVQVLTLDCKMLKNISLHDVGITDLVIKDCPKLQSLTGSVCRVLKNVMIQKASKLGRVSFAQCPKLCHKDLVDDLCRQPPEKYRLIFLRPVKDFTPEILEEQLFSTVAYKYHVGLIQDHSPDPEQTLYNRIRIASWPDVISTINYELVKKGNIRDAAQFPQIQKEYPWRQGTYRMHGLNANGSTWELVTDIPWIQPLSADTYSSSSDCMTTDDLAGLYSPSRHGHMTAHCWCLLQHDIAEIRQIQRPLYLHPTIVYVNTCDTIGEIIRDKYI